eukprot:2043754-Pyramimonas_sp.AAC.1
MEGEGRRGPQGDGAGPQTFRGGAPGGPEFILLLLLLLLLLALLFPLPLHRSLHSSWSTASRCAL